MEPSSTVNARELARKLIDMVVALHGRGFESLALVPAMSPSGMSWRYTFGAIPPTGIWGPLSLEPQYTRGSLGTPRLKWASVAALPAELADAFETTFDLTAARAPNPAYVQWLRDVIAELPPDGAFILAADYNDYERVVLSSSGPPRSTDLPMPPGFRH